GVGGGMEPGRVGVARQGMQDEDGVGPLGIEGAVGLVRDGDGAQLAAAIQLQLARRVSKPEFPGGDYANRAFACHPCSLGVRRRFSQKTGAVPGKRHRARSVYHYLPACSSAWSRSAMISSTSSIPTDT